MHKYEGIITRRRVKRVLGERFNEWFRKIVVNRRLLKRVFKIGLEMSAHFQYLRGNRGKSEFNLLRDIVLEWKEYVGGEIRERRVAAEIEAGRAVRRAMLLSTVFVTWKRWMWGVVVAREFRVGKVMEKVRGGVAMSEANRERGWDEG